MTPTERSLRLSAAMSEREMRMYRALEDCAFFSSVARSALAAVNAEILRPTYADLHAFCEKHGIDAPRENMRGDELAHSLIAIATACISIANSDPGPAPITTGA